MQKRMFINIYGTVLGIIVTAYCANGQSAKATAQVHSAAATNPKAISITYCDPVVPKSLRRSHVTFSSLYAFKISKKGTIKNITKIRDSFIGKAAVKDCLSKWKVSGPHSTDVFTVYFFWKPSIGWGTPYVAGNETKVALVHNQPGPKPDMDDHMGFEPESSAILDQKIKK